MVLSFNAKGITHWLLFFHNYHGLIPNLSEVYGTSVLTVSQEDDRDRSLSLGLSIKKVNTTYLPGYEEEGTCSGTYMEIDVENCLETTLVSKVGCR